MLRLVYLVYAFMMLVVSGDACTILKPVLNTFNKLFCLQIINEQIC